MKRLLIIFFLVSVSLYGLTVFRDNDTKTQQDNLNKFIDPRDNEVYKTVKIGQTTWFAENLRHKTPKSVCYNDDTTNCKIFGRLYSKQEAIIACPSGWRLPSLKEWEALKPSIKEQGIFSLLDTAFWKDNYNHTNTLGLSLLPAGMKDKKEYMNLNLNTTIWFSDPQDTKANHHLHVDGNNNYDSTITHTFHNHRQFIKRRKFSVRCVCDN